MFFRTNAEALAAARTQAAAAGYTRHVLDTSGSLLSFRPGEDERYPWAGLKTLVEYPCVVISTYGAES